MLKIQSEPVIDILHKICNRIQAKWPEDWTRSMGISMYEKAAKDHQCNNYRAITLVNHNSKVFL